MAALLACLGVSLASGLFLALHQTRDLTRYFALQNHVSVGMGGAVILLALVFRHLRQTLTPSLAAAAVGFIIVFHIVAFAELGPYARFFLPLLIWIGFIGVTLLRSKEARSPEAVIGFIALTAWVLLSSTGFFLAGPVRAIRTSLYSQVHAWVGTIGSLVILGHILRKSSLFAPRAWRLPALLLGGTLAAHYVWAAWQRSDVEETARLRYVAEGVPASSDGGPEGCGFKGCHTEITKQWQFSAHGFAGSNLPYLKVAALFEEERGKDARAYCEHCHEPTRFMAASYTSPPASSSELGVSCRACHLIDSVAPAASNGEFLWAAEPAFLPGRSTGHEPWASLLRNYVRDDLLFHRNAYQRDVLRSDEYCASCHRVKIPAEFNGEREIVVDGVHKSWSRSRQAREGINCVHCHMQLFAFEDPDSFEVRGHARPDHRTLGIHTSLDEVLPAPPAAAEVGKAFLRDTAAWLDGTLPVSEYEQFFLWYTRDPRSRVYRDYFKARPLLDMAIESSISDGFLRVLVRTGNRRISHEFPGGLLLLVDAWLDLEVKDASDRTLYSEGALQSDGSHEPTSHRLGLDGFDREGRPIRFNRFWALARVENKRVIGPDETIEDRFEIPLPPNPALPLEISARWWYRRYKDDFAQWALGPTARLRAVPVASAGHTFSGTPR